MRNDDQGQEIRKLRLDANITLDVLAKRVCIDFSYLSRIEVGQRKMSQELYFNLRKEIIACAKERLEAVSSGS